MSAFAVIYECSDTITDPAVLNRVMERLSHRGPDGSDVLLSGRAALGHWHFWSTPEESGERQPIRLDGLPFILVFDGRLDNREDLLQTLCINPLDGPHISDAVLVMRAYAHWGRGCFEHFIGEYALVILDEQHDELLCIRDALGDRTLFYLFVGTRLIVASEPWAVAAALQQPPALDERAAAHYFAFEATSNGQTLYKGIYELLPAHVMAVTPSGKHMWRYWEADTSIQLRYQSEEEYAQHFLSLLQESVRCRLRSTTPVGVLMSGGHDSGSAASLAARLLAPQQLPTFSYVFDELSDCDERQYIEAVREKWGIRSIQIPCDDAWPYRDWHAWPQNPNHPEANGYRLLKERTYKRVQEEGIRVLLSGGLGDLLYLAGQYCLIDLLLDRRVMDAAKELQVQIRNRGLLQTLSGEQFRRAITHWLSPMLRRRFSRPRSTERYWLTPLSADYITSSTNKTTLSLGRYAGLLGLHAAQDISREIYHTSHYGFELRDPYRDRRLVEFSMAIPVYLLYRHGVYKHILRVAMQGILPEAIRNRRQRTSLTPLFLRGIEREHGKVLEILHESRTPWRQFVREDWLLDAWNNAVGSTRPGRELAVSWLCVSFDAWYKFIYCSTAE